MISSSLTDSTGFRKWSLVHLGLLFEISALSEGFSLSEFEFKIKWFWVLQGNNRLEWSLSNRHSRSTVRSILAAWDWTWTLTPQRPPQSNLWNQSTRTKMKALCMICDRIIANYESVMLEIHFFFWDENIWDLKEEQTNSWLIPPKESFKEVTQSRQRIAWFFRRKGKHLALFNE